MAHKVVSDEELKLLLSPDSGKEEKEPPKYPKLSMKYLYGLVTDLQQENRLLVQRVDQLEQQLAEFYQTQADVAATAEVPVYEEPIVMAEMKKIEDPKVNLCPDISDITHTIRMSRSERHPASKKKSFWAACAVWFRPSLYRQHR